MYKNITNILHHILKVYVPVCLLACTGTCLSAQTYIKNKYGLEIIDNIYSYRKIVDKDSLQKLVLLSDYIPGLKTSFVYATQNNFTHTVLYHHPKPYLRLQAAKALLNAAKALQEKGFGIILYDAYRPYSITEKMWQAVPDSRYAANPKYGSGHNKGVSVDISLYYLSDGKLLKMPTGFDNFTEKAHQDYTHLSKDIIANRTVLKETMTANGFIPLSTEWWHFSFPNPGGKYKILNIDFDDLNNSAKERKP